MGRRGRRTLAAAVAPLIAIAALVLALALPSIAAPAKPTSQPATRPHSRPARPKRARRGWGALSAEDRAIIRHFELLRYLELLRRLELLWERFGLPKKKRHR